MSAADEFLVKYDEDRRAKRTTDAFGRQEKRKPSKRYERSHIRPFLEVFAQLLALSYEII